MHVILQNQHLNPLFERLYRLFTSVGSRPEIKTILKLNKTVANVCTIKGLFVFLHKYIAPQMPTYSSAGTAI